MRRGTEVIKTVEYTNGRRVATVEQVISRADDCEAMGDLYFRLSNLYRRLEDVINEAERAGISGEIADVRAEIARYAGYLDGYTD